MATKYYCSRYEKEVELYGNHCLGCSLFPFNVGECPSRKNQIIDNYGNPIDACVAMIEKLHELKLL